MQYIFFSLKKKKKKKMAQGRGWPKARYLPLCKASMMQVRDTIFATTNFSRTSLFMSVEVPVRARGGQGGNFRSRLSVERADKNGSMPKGVPLREATKPFLRPSR